MFTKKLSIVWKTLFYIKIELARNKKTIKF